MLEKEEIQDIFADMNTALMMIGKSRRQPVWIKGIRGEIVSLDSVECFWKKQNVQTSKWEVWVSSRKHKTQIHEGSKGEVLVFMHELNDLFEPYDLTNPEDRERLKGDV